MGRDGKPVLSGRAVLVACVACALLGAIPARAQTKQAQAEARRHFEQGEAYFKARVFDKAALEYQQAYDLFPEPALLFNVGLARENAGDAEGAVGAYARFLEKAPQAAKAPEARARSEALTRKIEEARAPASLPASAPAPAEQAPPPKPPPPPEAPPRPSLLPGLVTIGAGVVVTGAGVLYWRKARHLEDELDAQLDAGDPPLDSRDPRFDEGKTADLRAQLLFGAGAAVVAVGALLTGRALLFRPRPDPTLRPARGPGTFGIAIEGAW